MNWLEILGWIALIIVLTGGWGVVLLQVPPVPSRAVELKEVFELAAIQPGELIVDLGAGDGRVLEQARKKYKARVSGWELNPVMWALAKLRLGADSDIRFANLWRADVSGADVVFAFLMRDLMARFEREIWPRMKPGARLVSNSFPLPNIVPTKAQNGVFIYRKPEVS